MKEILSIHYLLQEGPVIMPVYLVNTYWELYKGVVAALAIPSSITLYGGTLDLEDYLIIGVSQSGKAADALAVIEQ
jgi:fructoselysine-6-P-deglycase FrlB-like protein